MSFSTQWLALREPADRAARATGLVDALAEMFDGRAPNVVDLGAGTGATWRAVAHRLPNAAWTLVDHDPALLAEAKARTGAAVRLADLAERAPEIVRGADLVTASALFDLCGEAWTERALDALAPGAALYAALTYDGRETWSPAAPAEPDALSAFHADQRRDKGFGPAMGPDAAARLVALCEARGWPVATAQSDWSLNAADRPLIQALADGAAEAVRSALDPAVFDQWRETRRSADTVVIGHVDILAARPA